MAKISELDHLYDNIEDYFEEENIDDEMSYLGMGSDDDFEKYLDYRATRKKKRKDRDAWVNRHEASTRKLQDDWDDVQYG